MTSPNVVLMQHRLEREQGGGNQEINRGFMLQNKLQTVCRQYDAEGCADNIVLHIKKGSKWINSV